MCCVALPQAEAEKELGLAPTPFMQNLSDPRRRMVLQSGFVENIVQVRASCGESIGQVRTTCGAVRASRLVRVGTKILRSVHRLVPWVIGAQGRCQGWQVQGSFNRLIGRLGGSGGLVRARSLLSMSLLPAGNRNRNPPVPLAALPC